MDNMNNTSRTYRQDPIRSNESTIITEKYSVVNPDHKPHPTNDTERHDGSLDETARSEVTEDDEETYPEGGVRAWLVVLGSWMALFSSLGLMNTMATFQAYIATNQLSGYTDGTIGWIFSLYAFLCFFCGLYIGPIFDKHGPKWLILSGTVCLVASLILTSFCTGEQVLTTTSYDIALTDCSVLALYPGLWNHSWCRGILTFHSVNRGGRPLLQGTTGLGYGHCVDGRILGGNRLSVDA
jgi:hypothetical protein